MPCRGDSVMMPPSDVDPMNSPDSSDKIVPGHYKAPLSVRAAASFARYSRSRIRIIGLPPRKLALFVMVFVALFAVSGIGVAVALRVMRSSRGPLGERSLPDELGALPSAGVP